MTQTSDRLTADRVARNDATFRAANESISEAARAYDFPAPLPLICECAWESCHEIVRVPAAEYERIRARPTWFLNAPGHEAAAGPHGVVAEERDGYVIVEKVGRAGELAAELDERQNR